MKRRVVSPPSLNTADLLDRARKLAPALAAAADQLKETIVDVEKALVSLRLGVRASTCLAIDDEGEDHLAFAQHEGAWKLVLERRPLGAEPDAWLVTPLLSAPRDARVEAVDSLPTLLAEMIQTVEQQIATVRTKTAQASEFCSTLKWGARNGLGRASIPPASGNGPQSVRLDATPLPPDVAPAPVEPVVEIVESPRA